MLSLPTTTTLADRFTVEEFSDTIRGSPVVGIKLVSATYPALKFFHEKQNDCVYYSLTAYEAGAQETNIRCVNQAGSAIIPAANLQFNTPYQFFTIEAGAPVGNNDDRLIFDNNTCPYLASGTAGLESPNPGDVLTFEFVPVP
jgi:hypothetical protein